eukprot:2199197-Rhodomonas_salina.1
MAKQRAVNEQHEQAKLERATNAINRKVSHLSTHVREATARSSPLSAYALPADIRASYAMPGTDRAYGATRRCGSRAQAVWMMLAALGERMAAWQHTFAYVRAVREDFGMWVRHPSYRAS